MGGEKRGRHNSVPGRRIMAAAAGVLLALVVAGGPASATLYSGEHYSSDYAFTVDCGFLVDISGHTEGLLQVRTGKGSDASAFFAHDNYEYTEVWTRRDTGVVLTASGNGNFKETKATHVSGTIFEFTSINAGQPFVVRDAAGNIVLRDRGVVRVTILFDTLGDAMPGGDFIQLVSVSASGPHPGLDQDACTLLA